MSSTASDRSDAIRTECERAIRRLDVLIRERDDVLLHQVRAFVRRAAALAGADSRIGAA
jgi:hypothetical protein